MKIKIISKDMQEKFCFLPGKEYEATCKTLTEGADKGKTVYFADNEDGRIVGFLVPGKINSLVQEVT